MTKTTPPHLITLVLLAGLSPLSLNMFTPSLANIAADLSTDYSTVSLAVSGYLAVTAVVQLIAGPLSDRIGRRPVLLVAMGIFAVASVGCALATDVRAFLFFRVLQAGVTAGYTLSAAIVRDTRSDRQAASLIGYIGMSMAIAPMLGPAVGGLLDTALGWRAVFALYSAFGAALFVICWLDLGETKRDAGTTSPKLIANVGALVAEPIFRAYALCGAFSVGGFYIFVTGAPLVAVSAFGLSTAELGVYIGSITLGFMGGSFVAGRFGARFDLTSTLLAGRVVACLGLGAGLTLWAMGVRSSEIFFASTIFVGVGNGITMPSAAAGAMSVRPDLSGAAAGLNGALVVTVGSVLTAATGLAIGGAGAAATLLSLMLGASLVSLGFAIRAGRAMRIEG